MSHFGASLKPFMVQELPPRYEFEKGEEKAKTWFPFC